MESTLDSLESPVTINRVKNKSDSTQEEVPFVVDPIPEVQARSVPPQPQPQYSAPPQPQAQYRSPPQPQPQYRPQDRGFTMANLNTLYGRPISRRTGSEKISAYKNTLEKLRKEYCREAYADGFKIIALDKEQTGIGPFSCLIMTYSEVVSGRQLVSLFLMVVEGSGQKPNPKIVNIAGRQVEVELVTGDIIDHILPKVQSFIRTQYGGDIEILGAGEMVIPSELDPEDEFHLQKILTRAVQACYEVMTLNVTSSESPFNVQLLTNARENLVAKATFRPGDVENSVGSRIRSDLEILIQSSTPGQNDFGFEEMTQISRINGYIDLVYSPPPMTMGYNTIAPVTQQYYPRLIVTNMDSDLDIVNIEIMLLNVAVTATMLSRNYMWLGAFSPDKSVPATAMDHKDIGAIGYKINFAGNPSAQPAKIDTKSHSFNEREFFQLATFAIHNNLWYSMDVEETGELSWLHHTWLAAANLDRNAIDTIIRSADNLTGGLFSQEFLRSNSPLITYEDRNRIQLGYYINEGVKYDLRDIDMLWVLNEFGRSDPELVDAWASTYDNDMIELEVRLEERTRILKLLLGANNVVIKGYARRITFDPMFVIALSEACIRAGLTVKPSNVIQDFGSSVYRGNQNAARFGITPNAVGNMFSHGNSKRDSYYVQPQYSGRPRTGGI